MASSPLDPSIVSIRADRILGRGHATGALGPSDSSDSGTYHIEKIDLDEDEENGAKQ